MQARRARRKRGRETGRLARRSSSARQRRSRNSREQVRARRHLKFRAPSAKNPSGVGFPFFQRSRATRLGKKAQSESAREGKEESDTEPRESRVAWRARVTRPADSVAVIPLSRSALIPKPWERRESCPSAGEGRYCSYSLGGDDDAAAIDSLALPARRCA